MNIYFSAILIIALNLGFAQQSDLPKKKFFISYFGETITHPGMNAGIEYYPYQNEKFQIIISPNIGGYTHIRNNTSVFLRFQWGQRIIFKTGVIVEEFLGLGYLHHFSHGGENYEVLPNGGVVEVKKTGNPMFMPSLQIGTGYDFSKKTNLNLTYFLRTEFFWKAPFNGYYLTHVALNTGLTFNLNRKNEN